MFSEKSVLFRYYRNVIDSYRKKVMTIKITVLLPMFVPPSLFHRFDTDVYNKNRYISIKITVLVPIFVPPSLFNRFDTDVYNK